MTRACPRSRPSTASRTRGPQVWEEQGTYRFDRTKTREQVYSIDTPPPTVSGIAARRPRLLLHPHRPDRALPADARQARSSTRWAGTTTGCRPSAGCRTTTASAATRRCRTTPTSRPPEKPDPKRQVPISPAQLRRALRAAGRRGREGLRGAVAHGSACRSTGRRPTRPSATTRRRRRQRAFLRNLARGEAYQAEAPDAVGRHVPDRGRAGRAGGPRVRRRTTTGSPSTGPTASPVYDRDHPARADPRRASR